MKENAFLKLVCSGKNSEIADFKSREYLINALTYLPKRTADIYYSGFQ
jgi:hypothetical protein